MKEGSPEYMEKSKELLEENACKKIKTTMIGALESIETYLSYLWEENPEGLKAFQSAREEILNRGNKQIKNLRKEFCNYDINWKRYKMTIPMKRREG